MKWIIFSALIFAFLYFGIRLIMETIKWEQYLEDKERNILKR